MKFDSNYFYLCGLSPHELNPKPREFKVNKQIYDSDLCGIVEYEIIFKKRGSWYCFVNSIESDLEATIQEFGIKPIFNLRFIYLVNWVGTNKYKIGRTKNINQRCRDFSVLLPFKTKLINWLIADKEIEGKLHTFFKEFRINGEWFELTQKEVEFFDKIKI